MRRLIISAKKSNELIERKTQQRSSQIFPYKNFSLLCADFVTAF